VAERAVLVTGASRGIGRAVAEAFAAQGDRVAVHHRGSPGLAGQVLAGLPGAGHTVVQADLADAEAVRRMVDRAHADLGGLDVLVNNAGIYLPHPVTDVSYQQWVITRSAAAAGPLAHWSRASSSRRTEPAAPASPCRPSRRR